MATYVKIRGTDRGDSVVGSGTAMSAGDRGFRVLSAYTYFPSGATATVTGGTLTNQLSVTAKYAGTWANGHTVNVTTTNGTTPPTVTATYAAGTATPTFTVAYQAGATIAALVTALNSNPLFSYLYTAGTGTGDGSGTTPVSPGALAGGTDVGTGQPIWVSVNNRSTVAVDVDNPLAVRSLRRNYGRYISLGQT